MLNILSLLLVVTAVFAYLTHRYTKLPTTIGVMASALGRRWFRLARGSALVLTWGGLRGGISVALALSLPARPESSIIEMLTYSVVLFSVFAQGLTVGAVAKAVSVDKNEHEI
ncbi:MAG: hypothetical protein WBS20_16720 [Lysobacterales bacterium]